MTQPSKNGENAVDMLAVARIAQGVDIAGFAGPDAVKLVAPAKVNLFLDIGAKRADGYHDAVSIMQDKSAVPNFLKRFIITPPCNCKMKCSPF